MNIINTLYGLDPNYRLKKVYGVLFWGLLLFVDALIFGKPSFVAEIKKAEYQ